MAKKLAAIGDWQDERRAKPRIDRDLEIMVSLTKPGVCWACAYLITYRVRLKASHLGRTIEQFKEQGLRCVLNVGWRKSGRPRAAC